MVVPKYAIKPVLSYLHIRKVYTKSNISRSEIAKIRMTYKAYPLFTLCNLKYEYVFTNATITYGAKYNPKRT